MRWTKKPEPKLGDTRMLVKFAWWPVKLSRPEGTTVWLETYYSLQRYEVVSNRIVEDGPSYRQLEVFGWVETGGHSRG